MFNVVATLTEPSGQVREFELSCSDVVEAYMRFCERTFHVGKTLIETGQDTLSFYHSP